MHPTFNTNFKTEKNTVVHHIYYFALYTRFEWIVFFNFFPRAGCFLPLTQETAVSRKLGTRHRAAIGLTELVDAVAIVVSEESGKMSVVVGGRLTKDLDTPTLKRVLTRLLNPGKTTRKKQKR